MIEYLKIIFMAMFQGVAEFLPISSSGHLELLGFLFNIEESKRFTFSIVLHSGTLFSMLLFYFREMISIFVKREWRVILLVVVGSIPAGIGGVFIKFSNLDKYFHNLTLVGGAFVFTGILLLLLRRIQQREVEYVALNKLSFESALAIGFMQMIAILPGVSRSGATIFAGAKCRLNPDENAKYSFFLAMAAIGGATVLEIAGMFAKGADAMEKMSIGLYIVGFLVAFAGGYLALEVLLRLLKSKKLGYFGIYMFFTGSLILIYKIWC